MEMPFNTVTGTQIVVHYFVNMAFHSMIFVDLLLLTRLPP